MTPHNEAKIEDISNIVLMPGDPLRAKYIADTFLDDAKLVNTVRNMFGYTGFYKGKKIALEGEMHNDNYTGGNGEKVYGMRLLVTDIEFVDSKDESENVSQNGRTNRNSSQSSRNSGSNNNGRSSQNPGNSYQNSPYYKNTNQGKTNRTGSKPQRAQSSRQTSQNRYNVDEEFMNMGNEEMGDFC